jgi:hypothetical protein
MRLSKLPAWFLDRDDSLKLLTEVTEDFGSEEIVKALTSNIVVCARDCDWQFRFFGATSASKLGELLQEQADEFGEDPESIICSNVQWIYDVKAKAYKRPELSYNVKLLDIPKQK